MARQEIRDMQGLKAEIQDRGTDKILFSHRAPNMGIIGRYNTVSDITYDKNGKIVGYGNQLMTLLS